MYLTFVEARPFTVRWHERFDDEVLRALQNVLLENPTAGQPIPGCSILRKLRFGDQSRGKGKRGGVRVIYIHTPEAQRVDLITVYGKDEAEDLSKDEVRELCKYARQLREAIAGQARASGSRRGTRR